MSHFNNHNVLKNKMDRGKVEMTYQNEDDHMTQMDFSTNRQQPLQRTGREAERIRSYRSVSVCLVVLCVLLLTAVIVLCVQIYTNNPTTSENRMWKILNEADGWIYHQSSFYYISSEMKTWSESRSYCTQKGADLIIINNNKEQDFVQKLSGTEHIWIGLSDTDVEARWKWVDGRTINISFWKSGEPNSYSGDEDCAESTPSGWNDYKCYNARKWICEKKIFK